jgi:hypothetical protein
MAIEPFASPAGEEHPTRKAAQRRLWIAAIVSLVAGVLPLACAAAYVWVRYYRKIDILLNPARTDMADNARLYYFPIVERDNATSIATSYVKSLGGFTYHRLRADFRRPRSLPIEWCFRRERGATRYGFVVRRRRQVSTSAKRWAIDNRDVRIFWVTPRELDLAIDHGVLEIPEFERLPPFDGSLAERMTQDGDDLAP